MMQPNYSKKYIDIEFPMEIADNYFMIQNREKVDSFIFLDPDSFSKLFEQNTFYILGPKGSGKTLYAAYMCAAERNNTRSKLYKIDVSDYGKLIHMKEQHHLDFTDYLTMWKFLLLQKFLFSISADEISLFGRKQSYKEIQDNIKVYFGYDITKDSFNPVTILDNREAQLRVSEYLHATNTASVDIAPIVLSSKYEQGDNQEQTQTAGQSITREVMRYEDTWLRSIDAFRETIENIRFKNNHFLFVDGLDVRPNQIDAQEYTECIGALVRAVYDINAQLFGTLETRGKSMFKIVALTRTDIFLDSNLVNVTSSINDNCVNLDWSYSNEREFEYSNLYKMMNRLLGWNGESVIKPIDRYFSFTMPFQNNLKASVYIQRLTRLRPRDVVVLLKLIQDECKKRKLDNPDGTVFSAYYLESSYSDYYAAQVKSELIFKYGSEDIKKIFELTKMIKEIKFGEKYIKELFEKYCENNSSMKVMFQNHRAFVDLMYTLDIIGWQEERRMKKKLKPGERTPVDVHWHYREVKAIDESGRFPWDQFENANHPHLIIHIGARKHIVGRTRNN